MFEAANNWYAIICTSSIICAMVEFLIPPGKIGKIISSALSVFMICTFLNSALTFKREVEMKLSYLSNGHKLTSENNIAKFSENVNRQFDSLVESNLEKIIRAFLNDLKINPKKIKIFTDKNENNCIVMIRCKIYINDDKRGSANNVKTEKAKLEIKKHLNIDAEFVKI